MTKENAAYIILDRKRQVAGVGIFLAKKWTDAFIDIGN